MSKREAGASRFFIHQNLGVFALLFYVSRLAKSLCAGMMIKRGTSNEMQSTKTTAVIS